MALFNTLHRMCNMSLFSLIVLVLQNSALVVMTRFSRSNVPADQNYYTSTLILNQEVVKMIVCLILFAFDDPSGVQQSHQSTPPPPTTGAAKSSPSSIALTSHGRAASSTNAVYHLIDDNEEDSKGKTTTVMGVVVVGGGGGSGSRQHSRPNSPALPLPPPLMALSSPSSSPSPSALRPIPGPMTTAAVDGVAEGVNLTSKSTAGAVAFAADIPLTADDDVNGSGSSQRGQHARMFSASSGVQVTFVSSVAGSGVSGATQNAPKTLGTVSERARATAASASTSVGAAGAGGTTRVAIDADTEEPGGALPSGLSSASTTVTGAAITSGRGLLGIRRRRVAAVGGGYIRRLRIAIWKLDTLKLLLPAAMFTVQNFLIFVGLSNLDAVSFQVWSQTKLLSAALFSVWLLHRHLAAGQWASLVILTAGVLLSQLSTSGRTSASSVTNPTANPATAAAGLVAREVGRGSVAMLSPLSEAAVQRGRQLAHLTLAPLASFIHSLAPTTTTEAPQSSGDDFEGSPLVGIIACVVSGLSSSYAGVYFEKVVKTTSPTLAIRNIQLSLFGIPLAVFSMMILDVIPNWREQDACGQGVQWNIMRRPSPEVLAAVASARADPGAAGAAYCPVKPFYFWQNYDHWLTWGLVGIHALGGLLVALVVKYADNILKGFATGVAVIVSGLMSWALWGYKPSAAFVLGALLVTGSTIMFHKCERKKK